MTCEKERRGKNINKSNNFFIPLLFDFLYYVIVKPQNFKYANGGSLFPASL